jgi:hypothetical protein
VKQIIENLRLRALEARRLTMIEQKTPLPEAENEFRQIIIDKLNAELY